MEKGGEEISAAGEAAVKNYVIFLTNMEIIEA